MRPYICLLAVLLVYLAIASTDVGLEVRSQTNTRRANSEKLQPNSLCAGTERIVFSCLTKPHGPAKGLSKLASLCAAHDLTKEQGYLQYRYGLPGKVELEFPSSRAGTQQQFHYTHYMRYQVDLTEINFEIDGYQYQIFDDYNGEERPRISTEGVNVSAPGKEKQVSFVCRTKAKADYSILDDVLEREQ
ncbi:MAG TPA: hypothetical protein VGO68_12870 [Pyrinomonadaceae bacterium]|jgi:hypothetical protein|nr:hypothetical protein [Pyrinomonadaceae bacterium]